MLILHHAVLLGFGLKMLKISLNIVKVGMHSYFPNVDLNIWLSFNFEKLVKRETSLRGFAKGWNYFGMSQKYACMLFDQIGIQIYDQI